MLSTDPMQLSGESFLANLKQQDHVTVTAVIEAYSTHIFRACLGMGFAEDKAKEICHATWATFYEVIPRFEGRSHVRTFLFGILYNKVMEHRRASKKYETYDPIEEAVKNNFLTNGHWATAPKDPSIYSEGLEVMGIIEECLEHLPDLQKMAFTLKILLEHDSEEVCNEMQVSATNLRQLLFRGKARLRKCIDGHYEE